MMKNLILLFLFIGITIVSQAQTQDYCNPCPPECCITVCDADGNVLKSNLQKKSMEKVSEVTTRTTCLSVSKAACSGSTTKTTTTAQVTDTRTIETLPQVIAAVEGLAAVRSLSSQATIPLYKGEQ